MGMHVSVVIVCSSVRVIVGSFVHASVIISQEREKEEGSKSRRPTEARQGQRTRENRNSPNQDQGKMKNEVGGTAELLVKSHPVTVAVPLL